MARRNEFNRDRAPDKDDADGFLWRHWGDGGVGRVIGARIQGYDPLGPGYVDVLVGSDGSLTTTGGGGGGLTDAQLRASPVPVSLTSTTITGSVAVTGPLTDAQLRASVVPVSLTSTTITGSVTVGDGGGSLTVDAPVATPVFVRLSDGASAIATLPVSLASVPTHAVTLTSTTITGSVAVTGPLTDAQLRATPVPVSLTSTTITGSVAVTGPLTDAQLRAAVVPVSLTSTTITGSVAVTGPLTDVQLRATPVPVSGTVTANPSNYGGKTVTRVLVNQGAAGTTVIAAASASNFHKIIGGMLTLSGTGTLKFLDGAGDLTGAMDFTATAGFLANPSPNSPHLITSVVNSALSITTVTGAARGWLLVVTEP